MEDIYFCTILCFGNPLFLYVIFNLDRLYLFGVDVDLYDNEMSNIICNGFK